MSLRDVAGEVLDLLAFAIMGYVIRAYAEVCGRRIRRV